MYFVPLHSVLRSLAFHCFLGGGGSCRRQGKSAAPLGAGRGTVVGLIRVLAASFGHDEVKRARGARVRSRPIYQPRSRGIAKMGGPGAGGLWRGLRRSPSVLAIGHARGWQVQWFARGPSPLSGPLAIMGGFMGGSRRARGRQVRGIRVVGHAPERIGSHASRRVPLFSPRRRPRARGRP